MHNAAFQWFFHGVLPPFQGLGLLWTMDPGRRSRTRTALGYHLSGFQPFPGRVLMRFNEMRQTLQLRLSSEFKRLADEELRVVLAMLAGPGVAWELAFGSWVLLQPEGSHAYAQAEIRTLQADEHQRGCLMEERVLKGVFSG